MREIGWQQISSGIWKTIVGRPVGITPLSWMQREPLWQELERKGQTELPFSKDEIEMEETGTSWIIRLPLQEKEGIYGLGLQLLKLNHRGRTRYLRVNSDPKQDTGETHAPVPFLVTDRGYGVFVNTSRIVTVHCGSTIRLKDVHADRVKDRNERASWKATPVADYIELVLPKEGAEIYLISGPEMIDVVQRYNLLCGGGALAPRWGLGFWHRVPTLYSHSQVLEEALEFRRRDFPCDVIGLEPGWHSKSYPVTYEWSNERFPNPKQFVSELREHGFRANLWEHPYVSPEAGIYEELEPLSGSYSVWNGLAPDMSLPEAQKLYKDQHLSEHIDLGVSGYKHDECDGSELTRSSWMFPAHAQFPSGHDGEQMRQMYGLMYQRLGQDMYRQVNRRTYGLVRASNAGASSLPYVLYSDLYDHKQFIRALCNASFCGLLWTPEVRGASSAEDWVRRMQTVCFSPLAMLNAWANGTKPWSYPEVEPIIRHYIQLRMKLMPYLYNIFAQYRFHGTPPFRAMQLVMNAKNIEIVKESSEALNTTDGAYGNKQEKVWDDQFMMGDNLLVAPLVAGEVTRDVLLPEGVWFGLETGERYEGNRVIQVAPGLERIPVFVKEGTILPITEAYSHARQPGEKVPLTLVHFGDQPGELKLYDDDGETFDYEQGAFKWISYKVTRSDDGSFAGEASEGTDQLISYSEINWIYGAVRLP